jgi:hypothetical protein
MAKKTRSVTTSSKSAPTFAGIQRGVVGTEFNPDYTQIKTDLKRIGVLAGGFFAVLIALSFFLR